MKLYVIMHKSFAPRYRIPQFIPFFRGNGIETDVVQFPGGLFNRWTKLVQAREYNVVVLERKLIQPWDLSLLRKCSRRLIFDFDDAIMYRSSKRATPRSSARMRKFKRIVESCDLVLAGNNFLKEQALKFTSEERVVVIPTVVDLTTYPVKNHGQSSKEIVLGWIGSAGTLYYLNRILPTLEKVASRFRHVCLKIVCDQFLDSSTMRVIKKPWNESDEMSDLQSFDIGIMPLTDDLWARGKCALKIVQYMAVGIPVVCSPIGTNRDIVSDGLSGFWAETEREWIDRLGILIEKGELRRKMGRAGRQIVEEGYSLNAVGDRLVRIFEEL